MLKAALTKRQAEVLEYLKAYSALKGFMPSLNEIRAQLQLSSISTVHKHLEHLRWKGYISRRWNHARSIELREISTGACPYCQRPMVDS